MPESDRRITTYRRRSAWERFWRRWRVADSKPGTGEPPAPVPAVAASAPSRAGAAPASPQLLERRQEAAPLPGPVLMPAPPAAAVGSVSPGLVPEAERPAGWARRAALQLLQILLVLGIVTGFFLVFLAVLMVLFPAGSEAGWIRRAALELPGAGAGVESDRGAELKLWSGNNGGTYELGAGQPVAAYLTFKKNDVRSRRSEQIVWTTAALEMALYDRDAVQTLKNARAIVTFDESNFLDLGENAMVIIKRMLDDPVLRDRRAYLVVVEGDLRARIEATPGRSMDLAVATTAGEVRVRTAKSDTRRAEFAVKVNPDQSTTLTVFEGQATLTNAGKSVVVRQNESTRVAPNEAPAEPRAVLPPVALSKPEPEFTAFYRDFPRRIQFDWTGAAPARRYHIQVARDALFRDRVLDEFASRRAFVFGNLHAGDYFWRVSAVSEDGVEGTPSEARPLRVVRDREPPKLAVLGPPTKSVVRAGRVLVRGRSENAARVFVNGKAVTLAADGGFSLLAPLKEGANVIVVEAVDAAGNTAYETRIVNRKP